jgi:glucose/arabinose dehydrogenase
MHAILQLSAGLLSIFSSELPIETLQLPRGFSISVYASDVENARQMALGDKGVLFVGSRDAGKVYALVDKNGDGKIDDKVDKKYIIASGLELPSGIAFRGGSLYVAAVSKVLRYDKIESRLDDPPRPVVVTNKLPTDKYHGWKYLGFGPDGHLYVPVGVPCNVCLTHDKRHGSILQLDITTGRSKIYASGIRNSVGFDWSPDTGELWFTDNGRDWMGDNKPPDELNRVPIKSFRPHFGFPFIHGNDIPDPDYGNEAEPESYVKPALELGAHVAPLGMAFYTGTQFPEKYKNKIIIAEHGSWNRSVKTGYRLIMVTVNGSWVEAVEPFVTGWLKKGEEDEDGFHWGRPVDVINMPDGSLLVSDDYANAIYKISYSK